MRRFLNSSCGLAGRSRYPFLLLVILIGGAYSVVVGQQNDKRVEAIRRYAKQVDMQIAESESLDEGTGIYVNELVVNKGGKQWPAVGIYRTVHKFYYTFGDREKNPYPNRLLKITITTRRSNRAESAEFLFNGAGQLIFYWSKSDEAPPVETRYYFASQRLIRRMIGSRIVETNSREAAAGTLAAITEMHDLRTLFAKSLGN